MKKYSKQLVFIRLISHFLLFGNATRGKDVIYKKPFPNQWASKADDLKKIMLHLWSQKVSKYGGD